MEAHVCTGPFMIHSFFDPDTQKIVRAVNLFFDMMEERDDRILLAVSTGTTRRSQKVWFNATEIRERMPEGTYEWLIDSEGEPASFIFTEGVDGIQIEGLGHLNGAVIVWRVGPLSI
ncbi:MAG TPA: hypothetical protein VD907_06310 [Verrucomicrobiae bacterium]|nr:hypothetical protein [Verrucomicrobiae bacterium]